MINTDHLKQLIQKDIVESLHELSKLYYDDPLKLKIVFELQRRHDLNRSAWLFKVTPPENFDAYNNKIRVAISNFIERPEKFTTPKAIINLIDESASAIELPRLEGELILGQVRENSTSARRSVVHFDISWDFKFLIRNNSNFPAYNVKLEFPDFQFTEIDINKLDEYTIIRAKDIIELPVTYKAIITKPMKEAKAFLAHLPLSFPDAMQFLEIHIHYKNGARTPITNRFCIVDGKGYNEIIREVCNQRYEG